MNILLTGANGNFGKALTHCVSSKSDIQLTPIGRDDWGDLHEKLRGIDVVIHAASDLRTAAAVSPTGLLDSNILSTARLLEASKNQRVKRWVFLSSCAVYGEDMRTDEDSACCPITINGISKHLNEKLVTEFCTTNKIDFQILRVFNSYGERDQFSIFSKLKRALQTGAPFTINNDGRMQRDFIHINDVATIALDLLHTDSKHTHLNIGTGVATKVSAVVDQVREQFPQLIVQRGNAHEAEYSRACITRLREFWTSDFIRVEDYIREQFAGYIAAPVALR
jgi:UDP-glucose 4-epimerase